MLDSNFFLRNLMTVAGATVLGGFMIAGMLFPDLTLNNAKWGVFIIGGVMYALGWVRGSLDAQQKIVVELKRLKK